MKPIVIRAFADRIVIMPPGDDREDQILDMLDANLIEHRFSPYAHGHIVQGVAAAYKAIYLISIDYDVEVL